MPDVLIIGGGVAGSACAIGLRRRGIKVDLAERRAFPRNKVCGCCIGPAGIAELESLGVMPSLVAKCAKIHQWIGVIDGHRIELPLGDSIAISREELDVILLETAAASGARIHSTTHAKILGDDDRVAVELTPTQPDDQTAPIIKSYDIVVVAAGLNAGSLGQRMPWIERPHGPFGVSVMTRQTNLDIQDGAIHMICDDDGYVGVVRLANGQIDVAAALRTKDRSDKRSPIERIKRIVRRGNIHLELDPDDVVMTTAPLRRRRQSGRGRLMAIGDAAGYVEPFTGEGMTWALHSGQAAARFIGDQSDYTDVGSRWHHHSRSMLAMKKRTCRTLTSALTSRFARRSLALVLGNFPILAKPLIHQLEKPGRVIDSD